MYSSKFYLKNEQTWQRNFGKSQKSFEKGENGARTEETTWLTLSAVQRLSQKWKSWKIFLKENIFSGGPGGKNGSVSPFDPRAHPFPWRFPNTGHHPHGISLSSFHHKKGKFCLRCVCAKHKKLTYRPNEIFVCMYLQWYWFIEYSDFVKMWKGSLIAPLASVERKRVILSEAP